MFVRKLAVQRVDAEGLRHACPIRWIDNFAMRNFTNSAVFDDTLPVADGRMEIGLQVPIEALESGMADWFRRKGYLREGDRLVLTEILG